MKTIQVNGIIVHEDVITTKFACDYTVCKGRCCYISEGGEKWEGCEVDNLEVWLIERNRKILDKLLRQHGVSGLPEKPTYSTEEGSFVSCVEGGRCCLNCKEGCALKFAERQKLVSYGIPIACHLYPLVVTKKSRTHLSVGHYYDEWHLCDAAYKKGEEEGIWLIDFCKEAIIRKFGEFFFYKLQKRATSYRSSIKKDI